MTKMVGTRDVYGETLVELGEQYPEVVALDADLSGSTRTAYFGEKFPDRFFNMGVAEQNMMATAAGLAASGKIVFASTFAIFATGRAWEQVRQSICLPRLNVKIVASHGGLTVGADGASHQAIEDIALMRVLPNMTIIVPSDGPATRAAVLEAFRLPGPFYIRLSREKFPVINEDPCPFSVGSATVLRRGKDATVVAIGLMVSKALEAARVLEKEGLAVGVIDSASVKPIDRPALVEAAQESGAIVTAEDHSIVGGLGGAVAEALMEECPVPLRRVGIKDVFGKSGSPADLLAAYGLMEVDIAEAVREVVGLKQRVAPRSYTL